MANLDDLSPQPGSDASVSDGVAAKADEGSTLPTPVVPPIRAARKRRNRGWLLLVLPVLVSAGFVAALLTGYVPAARLPGALASILPAKAVPAGADNCVRCHNAKAKAAGLYLAVNGAVVTGNQPVRVKAGGTFEMAFHFVGLLGDPQRYGAVGTQIVVPDKPAWRVVPGTRTRPKDWGPSGTGTSFWSPAWENGGNGDGPSYMQWTSSREVPGGYVLSLVGTPFPVSKEAVHGAVLPDRGRLDPSDRDGVADHSGANAIVVVADHASPGSYAVEVYGVGHDKDGKRANISKTIQVQVEGAAPQASTPPAVAAPPKPEGSGPPAQPGRSAFVPATGTKSQSGGSAGAQPESEARSGWTAPIVKTGMSLYQANCASCHGVIPVPDLLSKGEDAAARAILEGTKKFGGKMVPQGKAAGGGLTEEEVGLIVGFLGTAGKYPLGIGPNIPHGLQGREGRCAMCHGPGKLLPQGRGHVPDENCTSCHMPPPTIPHRLTGREVCDACHAVASLPSR